jgi:putative tryptophan/tyrosine transport system substrate-binding protein
MKKACFLITFVLAVFSCDSAKTGVPRIGFLDFVQDETLAEARKGFFDALKAYGYSEEGGSIEVLYRNAQGDQPSLVQSCDYLISEKVSILAANTTLSTITAVQRTGDIPVCMMVAPRPDLAGLTDKNGKAPANLFGVYETLEYIDTSLMLVRQVMPHARRMGAIYNQSEPQSVDALKRIRSVAEKLGLTLVTLPVNSSAETQLITEALLNKGVDVFFALPDNVIFASFETVVKLCSSRNVPVFTSEAGLVKRGALAAFGADMYRWGYQAGEQAAGYLKDKTRNIRPEPVRVRRKVFNREAARRFNFNPDSTYSPL